jgi:hypothetical protein
MPLPRQAAAEPKPSAPDQESDAADEVILLTNVGPTVAQLIEAMMANESDGRAMLREDASESPSVQPQPLYRAA